MMLNYLGIIKMNNNMKTFNAILSIVILLFITVSSCNSNNEENSNTVENKAQTKLSSPHTMQLYDINGKEKTSCSVFKGEFDGHTWYVFYDNLAVPAVVHDPKCKCLENNNLN